MQQVLGTCVALVAMGYSTQDEGVKQHLLPSTSLPFVDACSSSPDSQRSIQHSWQIQSMALVPHSWWAARADWDW